MNEGENEGGSRFLYLLVEGVYLNIRKVYIVPSHTHHHCAEEIGPTTIYRETQISHEHMHDLLVIKVAKFPYIVRTLQDKRPRKVMGTHGGLSSC